MIKKAFTLVELVVVITILAILGTFGFISYTDYTSSARDSSRLADISNIKKAIDIFEINFSRLPEVTNPVEIKVGTETIFTQWTFWDTTISNIKWIINKIPKDPLNWIDYSYSLTADKSEYEIWGLLESDAVSYSPISQANAAGTALTQAFLRWSYNWLFVKKFSWDNVALYATPSITLSDTSIQQLSDLADQNKFVYDGLSNLPANFAWWNYNINWWNSKKYLNKNYISLYNWPLWGLNSQTTQLDLLDDLQNAYKNTDISNKFIIWKLLSENPVSNLEESKKYIVLLLNNLVSDKIQKN